MKNSLVNSLALHGRKDYVRKTLSMVLIAGLIILSCSPQEVVPETEAVFLNFSANGQTLPAAINAAHKEVTLEVDHDVDLTSLVPEFDVEEGYTVYLDGTPQESGISVVNFTEPVSYEIRKSGDDRSTKWLASALPLTCKILIDASHDGGVWWFPQSEETGFSQHAWHQGQPFANLLREKGFQVDELGRGTALTEEMFFGYFIIIRAGGFQPYTAGELAVYTRLIDRGMNLVFFTDHKKHDPVDELGDHLGLKFEGIANGVVTSLVQHEITADVSAIDYIAGSVLTSTGQSPDIEILGWLREHDYADLNMNGVKDASEPLAPPVMGIMNYSRSRIFFMGDMNGLEIQPQPFIDNLIEWMGTCFQD